MPARATPALLGLAFLLVRWARAGEVCASAPTGSCATGGATLLQSRVSRAIALHPVSEVQEAVSKGNATSWRPKCRPQFAESEVEAQTNHGVDEAAGMWKLNSCNGRYFLDAGLAEALAVLMEGQRVVELGAGCGCYTGALLDSGKIQSVQAFDGVHNIAELTSGLVQTADLTQSIAGRITPHDWTLCTEVGEHLPKAYEGVLLEEVTAKADKGVVLSWAEPGQEGEGHVNVQSNAHVEGQMERFGFLFDGEATTRLRKAVTPAAPWFKHTLMVFRRKGKTVDAVN